MLPLRWGESVAHLSPPFDLVLASDVVYDAACVPALIGTFAALCGPATRGLLAFEARPPVTDMALALLPEHGLVGTPVCLPSIFQPVPHAALSALAGGLSKMRSFAADCEGLLAFPICLQHGAL